MAGVLARVRAAAACVWRSVHSEDQLEYSVERMLAFREYSDSVSNLRVLLVLVLNLCPSFLVLLLIDVIPLQDPSAGWSANVSFWIRTTITSLVVTGGVMTHAQALIPTLDLKAKRIVIIVAGTAIGYTGSVMLIGALWTFPVPFTFAVASSPWTTCLSTLVVLTDRTRDRTQLLAFLRVIRDVGIQSSTVILYAIYNAVFIRLRGPAQLAFVLLLPIFKHLFKILVAKLHSSIDGDLLLAVRSSIDIFDALYTTKCMQSAGSIEVGLGVIAIDVTINLHAVYAITKRTKTLREMFDAQVVRGDGSTDTAMTKTGGAATTTSIHGGESAVSSASPLAAMLSTPGETYHASFFLQFLLTNVKRLETHSLRFASTDRYKLSDLAREDQRIISQSALPVHTGDKRRANHNSPSKWNISHSAVAPFDLGLANATVVVPRPPSSLDRGVAPSTTCPKDDDAARRQTIVQESMRLLHECESIAVIEYIETVVPVFYALYISILFHLPNAKYYDDMRHVSTGRLHAVVLNILVYALLELVSLVWVHGMLQRNFGISLFRQLAFTLENEWRQFQGYFASWIVITFQILLLHFGTDISLEFAWVHRGGKHHD